MITTVPPIPAVARPTLFILTTEEFDEAHETCVVISWLVPSEYAPVAVNCRVSPEDTLELAGVTDMVERVTAVTARAVLPEIPPEVAVMVLGPAAMAVARPPLVTVATGAFDEPQVTCVVISRLVPSEYAPVALNCWVTPMGRIGLVGVADMEDRVAEVTARAVFPEIPPEVAVMVLGPAAMAVARPPLVTLATDEFDEAHETCVVISWLVPSE